MRKVILILVGILCMSMVTGCSEKTFTVDAKNFAEISFEGLNTRGKAFVTINKDNFFAALQEYRANIKDVKKKLIFSNAFESIDYQIVSDKDNLTNGDEIKIKAVYDEALISEAKIKIENEEFTYTVSGLAEATALDPFAEIELVYEGASPIASVNVYNRSEKQFIRDIRYKVEPSRNLRIGDKIAVTAEVKATDAESNGFIVPDNLTKEYTVENIYEYTKDFNDIDQAANEKMKKEALDRVESYSVDRFGSLADELGLYKPTSNLLDDTKFDAPELTNIYFNTLKPGASGADSQNDIFYVYKVTAHYASEPEPRIAFAAVRFKDAIKRTDGSTYIDTSYTPSFSGKTFIFSISKDFDVVYREIATSQKTWYEIQEITL